MINSDAVNSDALTRAVTSELKVVGKWHMFTSPFNCRRRGI